MGDVNLEFSVSFELLNIYLDRDMYGFMQQRLKRVLETHLNELQRFKDELFSTEGNEVLAISF